ncbi:MAG: archaellin/type IV pilin N-terminal domain-containing protein [Candidatus Woesearchaeota archaeon]
MNKKAEMGMGTLIIFIAMVLVAAVAASVLITTTGSLQGKALDTGMSAKDEVGTNIKVLEIVGADTDDDSLLDEMNATVKLAPGSESVKMDDLLLLVDGEPTDFTATDYTGGDELDGGLDADEIGIFHFNVTDINSSTPVQLQLIPKVGTPSIVDARTPTSIGSGETVPIFP